MELGSDKKKLMTCGYKMDNTSSKYLLEDDEQDLEMKKNGSNDSLLPGMYDDVALMMELGSDKKKLMTCGYKMDNTSSKYLLEDDEQDLEMKKNGSNDSLLPGMYDDVALMCLAWVCRFDYASLSSLNATYNSLMKSGYLYELRKQLGIIEHWVYMVSDPRGWEGFDPISKNWMKLPKMPCDECFNHADKESLAVGSELLVFGRELLGFAIWKYSLIHRHWVKCEGMNHPRCLFGSGTLGSHAIVAGGTDQNGNILKSAEMYDSTTGKWEMLPNMHSPRRLCSGFFMDGKFYVIGGMTSPTDSLTCGEELDLETRTWKKIEGMYPNVNRAAQAPPLVAVVSDELYAVEYSSNMVKKYDKVKNSWDVLGRLPVRADSSNGWGLAFKACGERLLVVGGQRGPEGETIVLNSWSPKSGVKDGILDWQVLGVKEHSGVFVYNCAVMGC